LLISVSLMPPTIINLFSSIGPNLPQLCFQLFFYSLDPQLKLGEEKLAKHRPQISQQ
jgi:hypothetical protein